MSDRCKICHAPIEWVKTPEGKRMPLDPTMVAILPNPIGVTSVVDEQGLVRRGDLVEDPHADLEAAIFGRTSHFATCPQAAQHRRSHQ